MKTTIVIHIKGGQIANIISNGPVEILTVDGDVQTTEGALETEAFGFVKPGVFVPYREKRTIERLKEQVKMDAEIKSFPWSK